jgi:hypothetical protein
MEVIGIGENDLRAGPTHFRRMEPAHDGVGADRHEGGRLHLAVREREGSGAGGAGGGVEAKVEHAALSQQLSAISYQLSAISYQSARLGLGTSRDAPSSREAD